MGAGLVFCVTVCYNTCHILQSLLATLEYSAALLSDLRVRVVKQASKLSFGSAQRHCNGRADPARPVQIERRRHDRFILAEPVLVSTSYSEMAGKFMEISISGASLEIVSGFMPGIGTEIALKLCDNKHLWGRACRVQGSIVAIEFPLVYDDVEDLLRVERRGVEIYASRNWR